MMGTKANRKTSAWPTTRGGWPQTDWNITTQNSYANLMLFFDPTAAAQHIVKGCARYIISMYPRIDQRTQATICSSGQTATAVAAMRAHAT